MPLTQSSDEQVHALARVLCFQKHGDWRYDGGNSDHAKWRKRASDLIAAMHEAHLSFTATPRQCAHCRETFEERMKMLEQDPA